MEQVITNYALHAVTTELSLGVAILLLILYGIFGLHRYLISMQTMSSVALVGSVVAGFIYFPGATSALNDLYVIDGFALIIKLALALSSIFALYYARSYFRRADTAPIEFPILILLSVLGMFVMVSANNFMTLYVGVELQTLPLYVLASIQRERKFPTEAGLKYFSLGALSSGLMLYGISLIYGFTGGVGFSQVLSFLTIHAAEPGFIIGLVFLLCGLAFKISAVPFHMWTPDVYQGAPTPVTMFFSAAPKLAALALLIRVLYGPLDPAVESWRQIIIALSVLSMTVGAFAAIVQTNIKRLLAYSSIGHMGYALIGFVAQPEFGISGVLTYGFIYIVSTIGIFGVLLMMHSRDIWYDDIASFAGLSRTNPMLAFATAVLMFSMAGIPPTAGFLGKLYIFKVGVDAGYAWLAIYGALSSVVAAYYYLRIVKVIYMDEPSVELDRDGFYQALKIGVTFATIFSLGLILIPDSLTNIADFAAVTFYPTG